MLLFLIEIILMLFLILFGLKRGGALGAGLFSLLGVLIMLFVFRLPFGAPPVTAVLIILSIGIAGGTLQATGGIDYLVAVAAKIIQRQPKAITFIAPLLVFLFVFSVGTGNIALSLEPIIAQTAIKAGVKPVKPLVATVLAGNLALLCSPAASVTAYLMTIFAASGITLGFYLKIVLPAALFGVLAVSLFMSLFDWRKNNRSEIIDAVSENVDEAVTTVYSKESKISVWIFLLGVVGILIFGFFFQTATPDKTAISMSEIVQLFMYGSAAINFMFVRLKPQDILQTKITSAAINASIMILGTGWLGGVIFNAPKNKQILTNTLGTVLSDAPWLIYVIIMLVAILVMAQTATASIMMPLALGLGVPPLILLAGIQSLNVNFVIPTQATLIFACDLDTTGSTKRSSFILPGFISVIASIIVGLIMISIIG